MEDMSWGLRRTFGQSSQEGMYSYIYFFDFFFHLLFRHCTLNDSEQLTQCIAYNKHMDEQKSKTHCLQFANFSVHFLQNVFVTFKAENDFASTSDRNVN